MAVVAGGAVAVVTSAASAGSNPVTPGTYVGKGFDQCEAPSTSAMDAWRRHSPYRAVGIYISGASRGCRRQTNLTPSWVTHQLNAGWHLLPITMGPQASCSTRFPRYGKNIDPTIVPSSSHGYAAARSQGRASADDAVHAAGALGIVKRSTLFYDLEGFDNTRTDCRESAKAFLSAWTTRLHHDGYASGVYSSASSGAAILDQARAQHQAGITLPDQLWIADWNGRADTHSSYVSDQGWNPHARVHQYRGGHNETYGGVTINIDTDYLDVRTPSIPGTGTTGGATGSGDPAPTTGTSDPKCTSASISRTSYTFTSATAGAANVTALQCLLKQQGLYGYRVTGTWNSKTLQGVQAWQRRLHHAVRKGMTRGDYVGILVAGGSGKRLALGATGSDVVRVQRALNAAGDPALRVSGRFTRATASAVAAYKHRVGLQATGVVNDTAWSKLRAGSR